MPMIYGEGKNAFLRLQEEIAKNTNDLTLFAWTSQDDPGEDRRLLPAQAQFWSGVFAESPEEFANCGSLKIFRDRDEEFAITNNGLRIRTALGSSTEWNILPLECVDGEDRQLGIYLKKAKFGYVRDRPHELFSTTNNAFWKGQRHTTYIARTLNDNSLALRLRAQMFQSLQFHFHLQPRTSYTIQGLRARPASLWDRNGRLFLTDSRQDFTACIEFYLKPLYWRFVIVCGLIDVRSETPLVSDLWDEDDIHRGTTSWVAIFSEQDETKIGIVDKLKNDNDDLKKLRSTVLSWYTDEHDRLPLRKMAETPKYASTDDGVEITYYLSMLKEPNIKGTPVFNIRVFMSQVNTFRMPPP